MWYILLFVTMVSNFILAKQKMDLNAYNLNKQQTNIEELRMLHVDKHLLT
jgi:hypothetical protein